MADDPVRPLGAPASRNQGVLSCLANLSNDGVLTPPGAANAMLDPLPRDRKISDKNHNKPISPKGVKGRGQPAYTPAAFSTPANPGR